MILFLFLAIACTQLPDEFIKEDFENIWWEFPEYPICFNFHESGDLLLFDDRISSEGSWYYCEPNEYEFNESQELITVIAEDECWMIEGYSAVRSFIACECTLR
tara:strand:+ start:94 stop:405 length:312 start_codon:yes stop_codon:yes gene_type:complete